MVIKKIAVVSVVSLALLGAGSVAVFADGGWKNGGSCHDGYLSKRIGKKLDLNDEQLLQFENLMEEFKGFRKAMFEDKRQLREEISALLSSPGFDREKALALMVESAQQKADTVEQEAPDLVGAMAEFADSLEPQQREKLAEIIEKRFSHGWRGKHHHGHYGERHS